MAALPLSDAEAAAPEAEPDCSAKPVWMAVLESLEVEAAVAAPVSAALVAVALPVAEEEDSYLQGACVRHRVVEIALRVGKYSRLSSIAVLIGRLLLAEGIRVRGAVVVAGVDLLAGVAEAGPVVGGAGLDLGRGAGEAGLDGQVELGAAVAAGAARAGAGGGGGAGGAGLRGDEAGGGEDEGGGVAHGC